MGIRPLANQIIFDFKLAGYIKQLFISKLNHHKKNETKVLGTSQTSDTYFEIIAILI